VVTVDYIHVLHPALTFYLADTLILGVDPRKAIPFSRPFLRFSLLPFPRLLIINGRVWCQTSIKRCDSQQGDSQHG